MCKRLSLLAVAVWAALLLSAGSERGLAADDTAEKPSAEEKIEQELEKPTRLEFIETPLQGVIDFLEKHHGIEIQIDRKALDDVGLAPSTLPITKNLKGLSLRSALNLVLRDLDLTYLVADEVLLVTTPEEARQRLTTKVYPVDDLPARFSFPSEARQRAMRMWSGSGHPRAGGTGASALWAPQPNAADTGAATLADIITCVVERESWETVGGPGSIVSGSVAGVRVLNVLQTYHVHRKIAAFLAEQRKVIRAARQAAVPRCPVMDIHRTPAVERIEKALKQPTEFSFVEKPLQDVIDLLKKKHKIEIQIDRKALDDVGLDASTLPITKDCQGISLRSALNLLLRDLDLTYMIQDEVLMITTFEEGQNWLTTRIYAVGDLLGAMNFPAVAVQRRFHGAHIMAMPEHDSGGTATGRKHPVFVPGPLTSDVSVGRETLMDLVRALVEPCSWDAVGGPGSMSGVSVCGVEMLVVSQTDDAHEQILQLLENLRKLVRCNRPMGQAVGGRPAGGEGPKTPPAVRFPAKTGRGGASED